jgi:hypothetical protein
MDAEKILMLIGGLIALLTPFIGFIVGQYLRILQYKAALKKANSLTDVDDIKPETIPGGISTLLRMGRKGK